MVFVPTHLKGLTIWPAYGKIVLDENMTSQEVAEAQKIYPQIVIIEDKAKKKGKK